MSELETVNMLRRIIADGGNFVSRNKAEECLAELETQLADAQAEIKEARELILPLALTVKVISIQNSGANDWKIDQLIDRARQFLEKWRREK